MSAIITIVLIVATVELFSYLFNKYQNKIFKINKKKFESILANSNEEIVFKYLCQSVFRGEKTIESIYKGKFKDVVFYLHIDPEIIDGNIKLPKEVKVSAKEILNEDKYTVIDYVPSKINSDHSDYSTESRGFHILLNY